MSIHQEAVIPASPERIYECLTSGERFAAVTEMPARMSDRAGEPFSIFGGRVEGRQIELVPCGRVVQGVAVRGRVGHRQVIRALGLSQILSGVHPVVTGPLPPLA